ncbi:uncharacterized protein LOC119606670 [Lucilia sericata]|uniref:uncharacterized protein LOC119606670 n=1 Tax=Lucilia sericata TaxID=13632 RepID=UPI0018A7F570|nr:uncharacterized protein LOC119606670 [Lucilia sericata]
MCCDANAHHCQWVSKDINKRVLFQRSDNISPNKMEVESLYSKYAGRVPPLDLSEVNSICSTDSDLDEMWSSKTKFITLPAHHLRRNCNNNHPYYDLHRKQYYNMQRHLPKIQTLQVLTF